MADDKVSPNIMDRLNHQFMPRETLNVTFNQLEKQLEKIENKLENLPHNLIREFGEKYGKQLERFEDEIHTLEERVSVLERFYWKMLGAGSVLGAVCGYLAKHL